MADDLEQRIIKLSRLLYAADKLVVFTGAGISTESGIPDFRGPNGLWTRRDKGLPAVSWNKDWADNQPNAGHLAIVDLQKLGKLKFLISQNIDNLHLKSGIDPDKLAELHGNLTKLRCPRCEFTLDNFEDLKVCPQCGGGLKSSVVDFGDSLPWKDLSLARKHSQDCDVFLVLGSSLVVNPAAEMPRIAVENGATLVIINSGKTPLDGFAELRFEERIGPMMVEAIRQLKLLMQS